MPDRRDYLSVCNDHGVPLPDFQATFCVRCVQRECTRSRGNGLFESRVATWEDRLFKSPARMEKSDPLYTTLTAKRFIDVDVGRIPEVNGRSDWMDPRSLEEPATVAKPRPARAARVVDAPAPAEDPSPDPASNPVVPRAPGAPLNTPFSQPVMLSSAPAAALEKPPDRWAAPPPAPAPDPSVPIVKVGARIKLGG